MFKSPIMALEHKSSDAGHSDMPKRSRKVLPLRKKVYVEKHIVHRGLGAILGSRHPLGFLGCVSVGKGGCV